MWVVEALRSTHITGSFGEKRRITEGYMEGDVNPLGPDEMVIMTDSYQRF